MIIIYGYSDDNVEVEGVHFDFEESDADHHRPKTGVAKTGERDEIGCYEEPDQGFLIGYPEAREGKNAEGVLVRCRYGLDSDAGVWSVVILSIDEDVPCPWPVSVTFEGYTAKARVDCPDGTPVRVVKAKKDRR